MLKLSVRTIRLLDDALLVCFVSLITLFIVGVYFSGPSNPALLYLEYVMAFFGGLYAGKVLTMGKIVIGSISVFLLSWLLDPAVFTLFGWFSGRNALFLSFYVNGLVAFSLLFGAIVSARILQVEAVK